MTFLQLITSPRFRSQDLPSRVDLLERYWDGAAQAMPEQAEKADLLRKLSIHGQQAGYYARYGPAGPRRDFEEQNLEALQTIYNRAKDSEISSPELTKTLADYGAFLERSQAGRGKVKASDDAIMRSAGQALVAQNMLQDRSIMRGAVLAFKPEESRRADQSLRESERVARENIRDQILNQTGVYAEGDEDAYIERARLQRGEFPEPFRVGDDGRLYNSTEALLLPPEQAITQAEQSGAVRVETDRFKRSLETKRGALASKFIELVEAGRARKAMDKFDGDTDTDKALAMLSDFRDDVGKVALAKRLDELGAAVGSDRLAARGRMMSFIQQFQRNRYTTDYGIEFRQALGGALPDLALSMLGAGAAVSGARLAGASRATVGRAGLAGAAGLPAGLSASETFSQAREMGIPTGKASVLAFNSFMSEFGPTMIFGRTGVEKLFVPGVSRQTVRKGVLNTAKRFAKESGLEIAEEEVSTIADILSTQLTLNPDMTIDDALQATRQAAMAAGVLGLLGGFRRDGVVEEEEFTLPDEDAEPPIEALPEEETPVEPLPDDLDEGSRKILTDLGVEDTGAARRELNNIIEAERQGEIPAEDQEAKTVLESIFAEEEVAPTEEPEITLPDDELPPLEQPEVDALRDTMEVLEQASPEDLASLEESLRAGQVETMGDPTAIRHEEILEQRVRQEVADWVEAKAEEFGIEAGTTRANEELISDFVRMRLGIEPRRPQESPNLTRRQVIQQETEAALSGAEPRSPRNEPAPETRPQPRRIRPLVPDEAKIENQPTIFSIAEDVGGVESKTAARKRLKSEGLSKAEIDERLSALYEGAPSGRSPTISRLLYGGSESPDQAAQALGFEDATAMWESVNRDLQTAKTLKTQSEARVENEKTARKFQQVAGKEDSGEIAVDPSQLTKGDTLVIDGTELEVTRVETDEDGEVQQVIMKDGPRFGRQTVEPGQTMFVEQLEESELAPFVPEEESEAPSQAKLLPGEKQGDLLDSTGQDSGFALIQEETSSQGFEAPDTRSQEEIDELAGQSQMFPTKPSGAADFADSSPSQRPGLDRVARTEDEKTLVESDTTPIGFPSEVRALTNMALSRLLRLLDVPLLAASIRRGNALGKAVVEVVDNSKHPVAVRLREKIFQYPDLARMVLAHEIGHIIDAVASNVKGPGLARRLAPLGDYNRVFPFISNKDFPQTKKGEPSKRELERMIKQELRALSMAWRGDYDPAQNDYRDSAPELYADFLSAVLNDPSWTAATAPLSWQAFSRAINQKPSFAKAWDTIQAMLRDDSLVDAALADTEQGRREGSERLVKAQEELAKDRKEKAKLWINFLEENVNRYSRMAKLDPERADKLETVQQEEQAWKGGWNRFIEWNVYSVLDKHGIGHDQFNWYLMNHRIAFETTDTLEFLKNEPEQAREMLDFVFGELEDTTAGEWVETWKPEIESASDEELFKVLARASFELQLIKSDIDELLDKMAQKGEQVFDKTFQQFFNAWNVRQFIANPNGITHDDAMQALADMREELGPERYKVMQGTAKHLSMRFYSLMAGANRIGLIADEVFNERIRPNAGSYVPFQVAAYFMPFEIRAKIMQQRGTDKNIVDIVPVMSIQAHKWISRIARQKEANLLKEGGEAAGFKPQTTKLTLYKRKADSKNELIWFEKGSPHSVVFPEGQMKYAVETYNRASGELGSMMNMIGFATSFYKGIWVKWNLAFMLYRSPQREVVNIINRGGSRGLSQLLRAQNWDDAFNYATAVTGHSDLNKRNRRRVNQTRLLEPDKYNHVRFLDSPYQAAMREDVEMQQVFAESHARGLMKMKALVPESAAKSFENFVAVVSGPGVALDALAAATDAISKIAVEQNLKQVNARREAKGKRAMTVEEMSKLVKFTALPNPGAEGGTGLRRKILIPFYRTAMQGWRAMGVWGKNDAVGLGYILRTTATTLIPKMLMWAAASGALRWMLREMLGEEGDDIGHNLQRFYQFIPEYQKASEFIVPMFWVDGDGEIRSISEPGKDIGSDWTPIGLRIVPSDEARALGPLTWAGVKKLSPNTNDRYLFRDLMMTALSNFPPLESASPGMGNPALTNLWDAAFITMGGNPPDLYRRKGKFREDEEFRVHPWKVYFRNLIGELNPFYSPDVQMKKAEPAGIVEALRRIKPITGVFAVTGSSKVEAFLQERIVEGKENELRDRAKLSLKDADKSAYEFFKRGSSARSQKKDSRTNREQLLSNIYGSFYNSHWNPGNRGQGMEAQIMQALKRADEASAFSEERKQAKAEARRLSEEAASILNRYMQNMERVK